METLIKNRAKGVSLAINGKIVAHLLFSTALTDYSSHSSGVYSIEEDAHCLVISIGYLVRVNAFGVHSWDAESRHHKYEFSFNSQGPTDLVDLNGRLEYEYIDEVNGADSVKWSRETSNDIDYECVPLKMATQGMYRYTDPGTIDLHFQFHTIDNPFLKKS